MIYTALSIFVLFFSIINNDRLNLANKKITYCENLIFNDSIRKNCELFYFEENTNNIFYRVYFPRYPDQPLLILDTLFHGKYFGYDSLVVTEKYDFGSTFCNPIKVKLNRKGISRKRYNKVKKKWGKKHYNYIYTDSLKTYVKEHCSENIYATATFYGDTVLNIFKKEVDCYIFLVTKKRSGSDDYFCTKAMVFLEKRTGILIQEKIEYFDTDCSTQYNMFRSIEISRIDDLTKEDAYWRKF